MHWIQLKLSTTKAQAAYWEDALTNQGALAITLADAQDQPLFEPLPGAAPLWDMLQLTGLLNAETDTDSLLIALQHQGETVPPYRIEILEDKDWATAWMDNYQPIAINDRLWICPSWHQPPDPDATNIILDPGLAFGTGSHATTALCLEWLTAAPLAHKTLLDFGCGSGILGVGACLLGCHKVYAIDIDPQALQATRNNAATNNLTSQQIEVQPAQHFYGPPVDLVIANILAGPLLQLATTIAGLCKPGGLLALSGILTTQAAQVSEAYQPWFEFTPPVEKEGWVLLSARKKD